MGLFTAIFYSDPLSHIPCCTCWLHMHSAAVLLSLPTQNSLQFNDSHTPASITVASDHEQSIASMGSEPLTVGCLTAPYILTSWHLNTPELVKL